MASTSSIYGANAVMPYSEEHKADQQLTMYSGNQKSDRGYGTCLCEPMETPHHDVPIFTVYGPWGRPDMAFFKFARGIMDGKPIEIYNEGKMRRDFTYVGDIAESIKRLMVVAARATEASEQPDSSPDKDYIPFQIVNIGNSEPVPLLELVDTLERALGKSDQKIHGHAAG